MRVWRREIERLTEPIEINGGMKSRYLEKREREDGEGDRGREIKTDRDR